MSVDPLRAMYAVVVAVVLVGVLLFGRSCGAKAGDARALAAENQLATARADHAATLASLASVTAKVAEKTRAAEHAVAVGFAKALLQQQEAVRRAETQTYERIVAGVRDGSLQLRGTWACPVPTAAGPGAPAADPGRDTGAADDRARAAGRVVRIGDKADARLAGCQTSLITVASTLDALNAELEAMRKAAR